MSYTDGALEFHSNTEIVVKRFVKMGADAMGRSDLFWPAMLAFFWALAAGPCVAIYLLFCAERHKRRKAYNLPPGPPKWPILGNINVLLDSTRPLHYIIDDLAKTHGPIVLLKVGVQNFVFVNDPRMMMEFLKVQDHVFANRPAGLLNVKYLAYGENHIAFSQDGEHHTFFRKLLVTELLAGKNLRRFQGVRTEEQTSIIEQAYAASLHKEPVNLRHLLHALSVNVISRIGFSRTLYGPGAAANLNGEEWRATISEMMALFPQVLFESIHPRLKWVDSLTGLRGRMQTNFRRLDSLVRLLLKEHKQHLDSLSSKDLREYKGRDFMDIMLLMRKGEHGGRFSDSIIKGISVELIIAGSDNSAATMEWAISELLRHPEVMKKVRDEVDAVVGLDQIVLEADTARMPYLSAVIKETLRLHPPLPWLLPHASRADCKVGGYDIPAESCIYFNVHGIGRSASVWKDPLEFNPDRFMQSPSNEVQFKGAHPQLLPFGSGRRMCPGVAAISIIMEVTLARLVHSFDWQIPAVDGVVPELDMNSRAAMVVCRRTPLVACPTARLSPWLYKRAAVGRSQSSMLP